ncbi:ATP-dependent DNA helicase [Trichonephila clavipes]|nr:ATP-dependent DNA helicase [Trichonephila clavipes]
MHVSEWRNIKKTEDTRAERNEVRRLEQQQSRAVSQSIDEEQMTNNDNHRAFISDSFLRLAFMSPILNIMLIQSGDFRQTLPVIPRSTYADEINACLKSSPLWRNVEKLQLKINMRVQMLQDPSAETFSKQLLDIGDGKVAIDETFYRFLHNR